MTGWRVVADEMVGLGKGAGLALELGEDAVAAVVF